MKPALTSPAALTIAFLLGGPAAAAHPCDGAVDQRLSRYGLSLADMTDVRWLADTLALEGGRADVSGYQFFARPTSCRGGRLVMAMTARCQIHHVYTRGDCEVPGVSC